MFFESNYILNIVVAMLKYTIMEQVSTNVVINGEAINAGSRPIFLANSGRVQPMKELQLLLMTGQLLLQVRNCDIQ